MQIHMYATLIKSKIYSVSNMKVCMHLHFKRGYLIFKSLTHQNISKAQLDEDNLLFTKLLIYHGSLL